MVVLLVAIVIGTVLNPHLIWFSQTMENEAPSNTPAGIYSNLELSIPLVVVIMVVGILIYFVASTLSQEREYQVYSQIVEVNDVYGC